MGFIWKRHHAGRYHFWVSMIFFYSTLCRNVQGTVTQIPSHACVGEDITVDCSLTVPDPNNNNFRTLFIEFIVGSDPNPLSDSTVNGGSNIVGGVNLNRLTAFANGSFSTAKTVLGSLTLSSYASSDANIRLGCSALYFLSGTSGTTAVENQTLQLTPAGSPFTPIPTQSLCFGVKFFWSTPDSNRSIDQYSIYRNGVLLSNSVTTTEYADSNPSMRSDYSVLATSCAGNSPQSQNLQISVPAEFTIGDIISDNTSIRPALIQIMSTVDLIFNFTLYKDAGEIETFFDLPYSAIDTTLFSEIFTPNVCYRMIASVRNCLNGILVRSIYFVLPGMQNERGAFDIISTEPYHIRWTFFDNSTNCSRESYDIPSTLFNITVYSEEPMKSTQIVNFTLSLPFNFTFYIPDSYYYLNGTNRVNVSYNSEFIGIGLELPLAQIVPPIIVSESSTLTIILSCLLAFTLLLLFIIAILIFFFICVFKNRGSFKGDKEGKGNRKIGLN